MFLSVDFEYATIAEDWYKDHVNIAIIKFLQCTLKYIDSNAFKLPTLRNLQTIEFYSHNPIEFHVDAFNGLNRLQTLTLMCPFIQNTNYKLFAPIAGSLNTLVMSYASVNMYNLIGGIQMKNIEFLYFKDLPFSSTVTSNSLTKLPKIIGLQLDTCEIETIEYGAFNDISGTLFWLSLKGNKLIKLPSDFFKKLKIFIGPSVFENNPWKCDCNFFKIVKSLPNVFELICARDLWATFQSECQPDNTVTDVAESKQVVIRKCSAHYGTNALRITFTTFYQFKMHESYLMIKGSQRRRFYLFLMSPFSEQNLTQCFRVTAKYAAIFFSRFVASHGLYVSCVMDYRYSGNVWPLNCASFHILQPNIWIHNDLKEWAIFGAVLVYLVNFAVSCFIGICMVKRNLILMKGIDRVLLERDYKTEKIGAVLVMPKIWKNSVKKDNKEGLNLAKKIERNGKHSSAMITYVDYLDVVKAPHYEFVDEKRATDENKLEELSRVNDESKTIE